jgi:hypothetical protein
MQDALGAAESHMTKMASRSRNDFVSDDLQQMNQVKKLLRETGI